MGSGAMSVLCGILDYGLLADIFIDVLVACFALAFLFAGGLFVTLIFEKD